MNIAIPTERSSIRILIKNQSTKKQNNWQNINK